MVLLCNLVELIFTKQARKKTIVYEKEGKRTFRVDIVISITSISHIDILLPSGAIEMTLSDWFHDTCNH